MKNTIESIHDLQLKKEELLDIRNSKKKAVADRFAGISLPLSIISIVAKPIYRSISWMPIAISVSKTVFSLLRKKKR
ncbi:hypothetical protein HW49_05030 [Porphyromonadaceae bacterium COT-184 OH4590]|nr:hypothetical protein HW49_05030 [Porphyromonadaceae bacterium COT-184 OH4590]